jgi:hypothetical protein
LHVASPGALDRRRSAREKTRAIEPCIRRARGEYPIENGADTSAGAQFIAELAPPAKRRQRQCDKL